MPTALQRVTTEYVVSEDRIRLSGEDEQEASQVIWLTQRLLLRLIPVLVQRLEQEMGDRPEAQVFQSFAQEAAQAGLEPQAPVAAAAKSPSWVATVVDVTAARDALTLVFRNPDAPPASLALSHTALRQWLAIVHSQFHDAGWPMHIWPDWLAPGGVGHLPPIRH